MPNTLADFSTATVTDTPTGLSYNNISFDGGTATLVSRDRGTFGNYTNANGQYPAQNYAGAAYGFTGEGPTTTSGAWIETNDAATGTAGQSRGISDFTLTLSKPVNSLDIHITNLDHTSFSYNTSLYKIVITSSVIASAPTIPGVLNNSGGIIYTSRSSGTGNAPSANFTAHVTRVDGQPFDTFTWVQNDNPLSTGTSPANSAIDAFGFQFSGDLLCFAGGTLLDTPNGSIAVEDIVPGTLLVTKDNGIQPVAWVAERELTADQLAEFPKLRPIRICAGALGKNNPEVDVVVSPQHRVFISSDIAERIFGEKELLVPAKKLLGYPGIEIVDDEQPVVYHHILLSRHEILRSSGMWSESLFIGNETLKTFLPEQREELVNLFPDLIEASAKPTPARTIVSDKKRVKKLIDRHLKNQKVLMG